jgi:zinc transport system permease protein
LTGGLAGALLGFLGVQIVLRRMVFASSAIAQAAALGVALSFWVPAAIDPIGHAARHAADPSAHVVPLLFEPVLWALVASLLATLAFNANPIKLHLTRESVLGVVFLAGAAGTVIVGDRITQESHDLAAILFGSAVVVERSDLILVAIATVCLLGIHILFWRPLVFVAFDPVGARVQGLPVARLNLFVFLAVGIAVALATRALGALPVFAFSVLPAMAALALTSNLALVFALGTGIGAFAGAAGYAISFRGELPVGATQSAVALGVLALALVRRVVEHFLHRRAGAVR